jgi:hypothetical protein
MSTSIALARAPARIEPLEDRLLLASPEKFNLMSLLGYDRLGAWYKHRTTTTITSDIGSGGTSTVNTKTAIAPQKKVYDGHASNLVKTTVVGRSGATATSAWYRDSTGIYSTSQINSGGGVTISAELHDTRVGPKMLQTGKKYTDSGSFDGSFRANVEGEIITGEFDGTSSASAKIFGRESISVRGKTYANAVKGVFTVALSGRIDVEVDDESLSATMKATVTQTFWAAPGVGVVSSDSRFVVDVAIPGEGSEKVTAISHGDLVSYVLT